MRTVATIGEQSIRDSRYVTDDFVDSVLRIGTVDGRALARFDAAVDAERGLMAHRRIVNKHVSIFKCRR